MNNSDLKALKDLEGFTFVIPSYQRGYRWTRVEIERLLNDIYEFAQDKSNATYYPLQPIVVKKAGERYNNLCGNDNKNKCYVLIDGQQRLTTLYLIIKALDKKPPYAIVYETRESSKEFLKDISSKSEEDAKKNPDFHYMWKAYETIKNWLETKNKEKIANAILSSDRNKVVKVIWYEIGEKDEEAVFIRLNAGKIPLTDTELIRGYLLQEKNWKNKEERLRIAREWDLIQMALEDDPFWYFLAGKTEMSKEEKYETRMDLLFEIMLGVKRDEKYTLFSEFISKSTGKANNNEQEKSSEKNNNNGQENDPKEKVRERWKKIQKVYRYLRYFYENNELYHLIGFLTSIEGKPHEVLKDIYSKVNGKINRKDEIINYVKKKINKNLELYRENGEIFIKLKKGSERIRNLNYNDHKPSILRILLLFNILTAMDSKHYRFPFDLYHKEDWSLEHIHAQNDRGLQSNEEWIEWFEENLKVLEELKRKLNYYLSRDEHKIEELTKKAFAIHREIENALKCLKDVKNCTGEIEKYKKRDELKDLMDQIFKILDDYIKLRSSKDKNEIDREYGTHDISNLALLSKKKNSALSNQTFAAKRQVIIEMDKNGEFIPPATRNAFLKYYTEEPDDLLVWHIKDRKAYEDAIVERLSRFLNEISEEGGEHEQQG